MDVKCGLAEGRAYIEFLRTGCSEGYVVIRRKWEELEEGA
jgi:hypothetical protein